jgi:hypothetical protein
MTAPHPTYNGPCATADCISKPTARPVPIPVGPIVSLALRCLDLGIDTPVRLLSPTCIMLFVGIEISVPCDHMDGAISHVDVTSPQRY